MFFVVLGPIWCREVTVRHILGMFADSIDRCREPGGFESAMKSGSSISEESLFVGLMGHRIRRKFVVGATKVLSHENMSVGVVRERCSGLKV